MTLHFLDPAPENDLPVLLLHGLGADSRSWSFQFSALASSGYRPIAVDLPGFGQSASLKGRWNIAAAADQTAMWLKESEYSNIPVVGISMGGTVALQLAIFHPEVVNSLILVSTFACLRPRNFHTASYLMRRFLKTAMRGGGSQAEMVAWHLFPHPEQDDLRVAMLQLIQETDPAIYKAAMRALATFDVRRHLSSIRVPALVISGEQDSTVPLDNQRDLVEHIPGARQIIIPDARHAVTADHPDQFNAAMLAFLAEVTRTSAFEIQRSQ
jgi:pimeloyl-ACP methyl ester carboxylesterase